MADFVRYYVGDVVQMKKDLSCGCNDWEVLGVGVDCVIGRGGFGFRLMIPRPKFEKVCKETIKMRW